jgi:hypothetical protein
MATDLIQPRLVVHTESTGVEPLAGTIRDAVNAVRFLAADRRLGLISEAVAERVRGLVVGGLR